MAVELRSFDALELVAFDVSAKVRAEVEPMELLKKKHPWLV